MMQAFMYGRLGQAPRRIETKTGKAMAAASLAVDVGDNRDNDSPPEWFGLVAFGRVAEDLLRHSQGELPSAAGRVQRNRYTTNGGEERTQLQVVVDTVVSARTVRPGKKSGKSTTTATQPRERGFDDDLPF